MNKSTRCENLVEQFVDMVRLGKLLPGAQLPPVRKVAVQFGVSSSSVLKAFHALSAQGVFVPLASAGFRVAGGTASDARCLTRYAQLAEHVGTW